MKFTAAVLSIAALQLSGVVAYAPDQGSCISALKYNGINPNTFDGSGSCRDFTADCRAFAKTSVDIWTRPSCVLAATCQGVAGTLTQAQCVNNAIPVQNATSNFGPGVYSSIVHGNTGAPITQQNFIDFAYGTLSAIGSSNWPSSSQYVVDQWWTPLLRWTATGNVVPYNNFNDFLHYVGYTW